MKGDEERQIVQNNEIDELKDAPSDDLNNEDDADETFAEEESSEAAHDADEDIMSKMCGHYESESDVIRCKVMACFRDNSLCYR